MIWVCYPALGTPVRHPAVTVTPRTSSRNTGPPR